LIDNSPTDELRAFQDDSRIEYIFTGSNLGFGKAHNIAMRKSLQIANYHVVMNPDIYFDLGCLEKLFEYMEGNIDVGQIMPKILYPNGEIQFLCKLLPAPADLFLRRFLPGFPGAKKRDEQYELRKSGYDKIMNVSYLSGCFMFFRTSALQKVDLFDERIFMYIEDADLTRRMHREFKTIFYPFVSIYHNYEKGSYKRIKLMLYNMHGAFIYFNKWGWIFDRERKTINAKMIENYLQ
jgi:GT2 family glycosyltransferase